MLKTQHARLKSRGILVPYKKYTIQPQPFFSSPSRSSRASLPTSVAVIVVKEHLLSIIRSLIFVHLCSRHLLRCRRNARCPTKRISLFSILSYPPVCFLLLTLSNSSVMPDDQSRHAPQTCAGPTADTTATDTYVILFM